MSFAWVFLVGLGSCGLAALGIVGGALVVMRRRRDPEVTSRRVDPDREARDADRRHQQGLLAHVSRNLSAREGAKGRWAPRGTNSATGRAVLTFEAWRPVNPDGTRRKRRRSAETALTGDRWPFILAVDLVGLAPDAAAEVAGEVLGRLRETSSARVRLLTHADIASAVEKTVTADGCRWGWTAPGSVLDASTDGSPI